MSEACHSSNNEQRCDACGNPSGIFKYCPGKDNGEPCDGIEIKTVRCVICQAEFTDEEIENATCCPACGDTGVPCAVKDDVQLKINWHELRILSMWAERWALHIEKEHMGALVTLDCIVQRLQKQYPNKSKLTIRGEVGDVKKQFPGSKLIDEHGKEIETD